MGDSRNLRNVPNRSSPQSELKHSAQESQIVQRVQSYDPVAQGTFPPNNYGYDNPQHMDDMNSYDNEYQKKVVTSNSMDVHRQKPYEQNYTSTSGAKSLHSVEDACQYVIQMGNIWKVPTLPKGNEFLNTLIDVIKQGHPEYVAEHSMTNERGETTYVLVVVRATSSEQREVLHSFQQLGDPYMSSMNGRNLEVSQQQPVEWFRRKAVETLHIHTNAIRSFNMSYYESSPQSPQARSKKPIGHI